MCHDEAPGRRPVRSYVRREGRITAAQRRALEQLWPRFGIDFEPEPLDLDRVFGRRAPRCLEIGFGTGSTADLCFGAGMILVGVRGFLRPVMFGKALRMEQDPKTAQVSIGSPTLHGALSMVIFIALMAGIVIRYMMTD